MFSGGGTKNHIDNISPAKEEAGVTDKQLYRAKCEYMNQYYEEVGAFDFYREVFPVGSLERAGHPEDEKANAIMTIINGDDARNRMIFDELEELEEVAGAPFAVMSCVTYSGRNRTAANARYMYGVTIDLDGVGMSQLRDVFHQAENDFIPMPTYTINSGHGLHLYYLFEDPVPLYRHLHERFREWKYELIAAVWNRYTSTYTERDQVQYQGIFQGFRMVGTQSKLGARYPVRAWKTGERVSVEQLNRYLMDKSKAVTGFDYQSALPIEEARRKYPEWYERRIVQKKPRGRWHVNRALYDWWLRKIKEGASVGHRYSCLSVLAAYAIKCDIDEDELISDALALLPQFDAMTDDEHNRFTRRDVMDAMKLYSESYNTYSRKEAERVSGISIPPNKRNGRSRELHIKRVNALRVFARDELGEDAYKNNGRPIKASIVYEWRRDNPTGTKEECHRDTGLSRDTIRKWWTPSIRSVMIK